MNLDQIRRWRPEVIADVADTLLAQHHQNERPGLEVDALVTALDIATDRIRHVVEELEGICSYARRNGCVVDLRTGLVTIQHPEAGAVRETVTERLGQLLGEARSADADLATALHRAATFAPVQ